MSFNIDPSDFFAEISDIETNVGKETDKTLKDIADDLIHISSNIAPIASGTLRKSHTKDITRKPNEIRLDVAYSAVEESSNYGMFNYALWTHEYDYNLGPRSSASQGVDGYAVGNKYLSRPLNGEADKYLKWLGKAVQKGVDK